MNTVRWIRVVILCILDIATLFVSIILSLLIIDKNVSNFTTAYYIFVVVQILFLVLLNVYCFIVTKNGRQKKYSAGVFSDTRKVAIVYGAGETGKTLVLQSEKGILKFNIVGFIDDQKIKIGALIANRKVFGSIHDAATILTKKKADVLIIAIAQLSAENTQKAVVAANSVGVAVEIVPSLFELQTENKQSFDLRTVNYSDLLGRDLIKIDKQPIKHMIENKVVLVTGACGSIGSEIAKQAKTYNPKQLLLLDIDESGLHDIALRLLNYTAEWSDAVMPILCDIKNAQKIEAIMAQYKPDIVFHAAAYKHVPMVQLYPEEGITTNVAGSYNVLHAAKKNAVKKVVVISTDKAVNPTNVMGATKRMVELEASMLNCPETQMVSVRFGNVIGSRGSMMPLFLEEIQAGVPITVTDKNIIRYFMAIPEAVSLVFMAGSLGKGGEVMVLDMGKPINIYEFAQRLIYMYGDPLKNKIKITGLRPGEKMFEELLANKDNSIATDNSHIFKAKVLNTTIDKQLFLKKLDAIYQSTPKELKEWVKQTVPEFIEK